LVQVGTPHEVYARPVNTFVARAVGSPPMNLVEGKLSNGTMVASAGFVLPVAGAPIPPGASAEGRDLVFGIRPEDVIIASDGPAEARIHDIENHGVEKILTLMAGDKLLRATVSARSKTVIDETVRFGWNAEKL